MERKQVSMLRLSLGGLRSTTALFPRLIGIMAGASHHHEQVARKPSPATDCLWPNCALGAGDSVARCKVEVLPTAARSISDAGPARQAGRARLDVCG